MKRFAKLLKVLGDVLLIVVVLLLVIAVFSTVMARINGQMSPSFFGITFGRVVTGSMEPEIPTGSLIVARKVPIEELSVGEDILFVSEDPSLPPDTPVSHRIADILKDEQGRTVITTRGIANEIDDPYPVYEDQILGRIVMVSDAIGQLLSLLQKRWVYPILIGILLLDLIWNIFVVSKLALSTEESENE